MYIYFTYLIYHQKIVIIGNTSYTWLHQIQRLRSAFRTQIYTHTTDVIWKFFVYSRCWKLIDTRMSDAWLYVFPLSIKSNLLLKLLFLVYFPYMAIQRRGMYYDVISPYPFFSNSKPCVAFFSVLRFKSKNICM